MDYVSPLLDIIKSPETSGKLTAAALHGVQRILEHNVLGKFFSLDNISSFDRVASTTYYCHM